MPGRSFPADAIHRSPAEDDRAAPASRGRTSEPEADGSGVDLRTLNRHGRERQLRRLEKRGTGGMTGGMGGMMGGGFR